MYKYFLNKCIEKIQNDKTRTIIIIFLIVITSSLSLYFISNNEILYSKPIARIISVNDEESKKEDSNGKTERIKSQKIQAVILNGIYKGKTVELNNISSFSQANDLDLKVNDEVFISITDNANSQINSAKILEFKRDTYVIYILNIFIVLIILIGRFKGFKSLVSVVVNILILLAVIKLFTQGFDLLFLSIIASILFVTLSILIVSGLNKKTVSAIAGTLIGTLLSVLIAGIVIKLNNWSGIHFEEMEFLTHPPEKIFFIELIIGTLGGIMDIAISISSAIEELYDKNPNIQRKAVINSAREIGQDIMGTMANTLVFAYLSGSIPTILLLLRNGIPITYIINFNLSLEFMRALIGSIGIVLSIPITIFTSIIILKKQMIGEIVKS
ncbi:YibE/F family protein [Clostridium chromiireducens]|uniref:YibE/F family protein n=1 Tax=Clostridium chromiireducens TaxID=225345 RepID=A0A1V4IF14_9CLOT|nr:YibE/F family protein [Clostridium chromiireducens]OPJ58598.1 YibE/F-like protein [Clostridium chromiireducens]RII35643.1 YibE/F family protein [Clostridium chromiireducens]